MAAIPSSLILSALNAYVDQIGKPEILTEFILQGRTQQIVKKQTGVKNAQTINIMTDNLLFQATQCANAFTSATGSVTLSQVTMQVNPISVVENICEVGNGSLEQYWTGVLMGPGSYQEKLTPDTFAKAYVKNKIERLQDQIEKSIWQGKAGGTNSIANYNWSNGFLYTLQFTAGSASVITSTFSGVIPVSSGPTDYSTSNFIWSMIDLLPEEVSDQPDLTLFMSISNFRKLIQGLGNQNLFDPSYFSLNANSQANTNLGWSLLFPGTNINILGTSGLLGSNAMVLSPASNLYVGTDIENDAEQFDIWYSQDFNAIGFRSQFKLGTAVAFPQYVVAKFS